MRELIPEPLTADAFAPFGDVIEAPNGTMFDTAEGLRKHADKIYARAVATTSMLQGNETGMTEAERASLGAWIKAGATGE